MENIYTNRRSKFEYQIITAAGRNPGYLPSSTILLALARTVKIFVNSYEIRETEKLTILKFVWFRKKNLLIFMTVLKFHLRQSRPTMPILDWLSASMNYDHLTDSQNTTPIPLSIPKISVNEVSPVPSVEVLRVSLIDRLFRL